MNKVFPSRFSKPKAKRRAAIETWHNGADAEIHLYTVSLQKAAKSLVQRLEPARRSKAAWDVCPIILLYRQTLELRLKALVGEGSSFLKSETDPISLYRTHSLRWLAQIACQVIKAVGWEHDFTCEGVSNLGEFSSLINDIESFEPVSCAVRLAGSREPRSAAQNFESINVTEFAKKVDALLELLDVTADALAAERDERADAEFDGGLKGGNDFGPTVH